MTILTAVTMTDIEYDEETNRDISCSNQTQIIGNGIKPETRPISTTNTGWMLGTGWILFVFSQVMNFIFYKLHPSSPEMWTWGKAEELEEWEPQETQTQAEGESCFRFRKNISLILQRISQK